MVLIVMMNEYVAWLCYYRVSIHVSDDRRGRKEMAREKIQKLGIEKRVVRNRVTIE